ncbi:MULTISPECIES: hypothetical protein [unclassified Bradyrhizobium]|uniref:hypothetical protein n=1 Tax=unclassified Bradyrhizobium TaxID=2631580 RepID=UPI002FF42608
MLKRHERLHAESRECGLLKMKTLRFKIDRLLELERIAPLSEAARLAGISEDSLKRNHKNKIISLGPRRLGMRVRDALFLGSD